MTLSERLTHKVNGGVAAPAHSLALISPRREIADPGEAAAFRELKGQIHEHLLQTVDVAKLESLDPDAVNSRLSAAVTGHLRQQGRLVTDGDRARLIEEVKNEILGLGPLEPLLRDDTISDILVNGASQIYIERKGKLYPTEVRFQDNAHLLNVIGRIVASVGRRIDEASPMVDARLPDGSRVNAIIPPAGRGRPGLVHPALRAQSADHR